MNKNEDQKIYAVLRRDYLLDHLRCEADVRGVCTYRSTDIHHKRGRGRLLTEVQFFLACCRECHQWIELHPKEAMRLGLSESRLKKY